MYLYICVSLIPAWPKYVLLVDGSTRISDAVYMSNIYDEVGDGKIIISISSHRHSKTKWLLNIACGYRDFSCSDHWE